jgi:two-component system phosphate regulon sensor histidine kinase PhoR
MALEPISLDSVIKRVVSSFKKQAKERSITIKVEALEHLPKILADKTQIMQVVCNLVDNAIKYNHPTGSVRISGQEQEKYVEINITDTGIGIPEDDLPRLFERFYRVDKARSRELGGTGLGLSIVKHIIQAHNGKVSVQSAVGKGSSFTISLPKVKAS